MPTINPSAEVQNKAFERHPPSAYQFVEPSFAGQIKITNPAEHIGHAELDLNALLKVQQDVIQHIQKNSFFIRGTTGQSYFSIVPWIDTVETNNSLCQASHTSSESKKLKSEFENNVQTWRKETRVLSSVSSRSMHSAYQRIIGLGPMALPLIFNDLKRTHDHWFWALEAITGENPVPREFSGNIPKMVDLWLKYGERNGYIS